MEQEKLAELIGMVLSDRRIQELIRSSLEADAVADRVDRDRRELVLLEMKADFNCMQPERRTYVCCQEIPEGGGGFISFDQAAKEGWKKIIIYRPSLNLIAKLAAGIADEPALKLIQEKLIEGSENLELICLDRINGIKAPAYRKLFLDYIGKIESFGIKTDGRWDSEPGVQGPDPALNVWTYKALTERDLLDIERGAVIKIGRKCIVTSLAVDMARRKSIQICREGEGR